MTNLWYIYTSIMIHFQETLWAKFCHKTVNWHNSDTFIPPYICQKFVIKLPVTKICQKTIWIVSYICQKSVTFKYLSSFCQKGFRIDSLLIDFWQIYVSLKWYKCVRIMSIDSFLKEICSECFLQLYHDSCIIVS